MMNRRLAVKAVTGAATSAGLVLSIASNLASCTQVAATFNGTDITGADYARRLSLRDASGGLRTIEDFKGSVVVLFFGFVQCPDVCPTTLTDLAEIKRRLGPDGHRLQVLFVTVDPERDTPEVMKAYMEAFDPAFIALIPTPDQLIATAKEYKVYYKKVDGTTPTNYSMDHSAGRYVYDTLGRLRLYERYGVDTDALAQDVRTLLGEAGALQAA
jgi:protein SCO1/2